MNAVDHRRISTCRSLRRACVLAVLSGACLAAGAGTVGEGLRLDGSQSSWPQWQTRLSVGAQTLGPAPNMLDSRMVLGASLAGDRYFNIGRVGDGGGLRATGALLFGSPSVALGAPSSFGSAGLLSRSTLGQSMGTMPGESAMEAAATPYLGMGYTAWWARSGLGLSADLGLLAQRGNGRSLLSGNTSLDDASRSYQLAPVLQVQLSYSF